MRLVAIYRLPGGRIWTIRRPLPCATCAGTGTVNDRTCRDCWGSGQDRHE